MSDGPEFRFIVEDEDGNRNVVPVATGTVRVGRQADNEICLPERNVSRRHATIELGAAAPWVIKDLDSYNGVFVNGQRVAGTGLLNQGDALRIGDFQLELRGGAKRSDVTNTSPQLLLGREVTQPEGVTAAAQAMANEQTKPTELAEAEEATDVGRPQPPSPGFFAEPPTPPAEQAPEVRTEVIERPPVAGTAEERPAEVTVAGGISPPFAHLLCLSGERAGTPFVLNKQKMLIGRTEENDIALLHRSISREHTSIEWNSPHFRAVDLDSSNGTLLNNESVQHATLHHGDILELGQIRLRYVGQGQPCVLSAEERAQVSRELRAGRHKGSGKKRAVLIGAPLLGLAITAAVIAWSRQQSVAPPPLATSAAVAPADEAASLIAQAQAAMGAHNYQRAQALAGAALAIDPARHEAQMIVHQAGSEERARQVLETASKAVAAHAWADAFNALQDMPKANSHNAEVVGLLAQVKPALVEERVSEARAALNHDDLDDASMLLDEIEALTPTEPALPELRHALELARHRVDHAQWGERRDKRASAAGHDGRESKDGRDKPAPRSEATAHPARPHPRREAAGRDSRDKLSERDSAAARAAYADGTRALAANQTQRAIEALQRCTALDHSFAMCYRALGIAYAKADNGPKAVHFYKLYLRVDPNARDAAQVRALVQQYNAQQQH